MSELEAFSERRHSDRVEEKVTILVVDDSTAIRRILRRSLEGAGYRVTEAADGRAAVDSCRSELPELILLDLDMPVMDGPTTLNALKSEDLLSDIPVLILTARTSGSDVAAGLALGAQDYLRKPCDPAELTARVDAALHQKHQRDLLRNQLSEAGRLSLTDTLTGLPNRRQFVRRIAELAVTSPPGERVGLLLIDVDHFKRVNDTHGHHIGDIVLSILAGRLRNAVCVEQLVVRWGGEEFVILAPGVVGGAMTDLAERIRGVVVGDAFSIADGRMLPITVSIGCASAGLAEVDAGLQAADEALYDAKQGGRNRVAVHHRDGHARPGSGRTGAVEGGNTLGTG